MTVFWRLLEDSRTGFCFVGFSWTSGIEAQVFVKKTDWRQIHINYKK